MKWKRSALCKIQIFIVTKYPELGGTHRDPAQPQNSHHVPGSVVQYSFLSKAVQERFFNVGNSIF